MKYRQIKTKIWRDSYFISLEPAERFLFIYFLSNPQVNKIGIYELPEPFICAETGLSPAQIKKIKKKFEEDKKIFFFENWIYIKNFIKHNVFSPAPNIVKSFAEELNSIPHKIKKHFFSLSPFEIPKHYRKFLSWDKDNVNVNVNVNVKGVEGRVEGRVEEVEETVNPTLEEVNNFARTLEKKIKSFE